MQHTGDFRYVQKEPPAPGDSSDVCHTYVFFIRFNDIRNHNPCRLKYVARSEKMGEIIAVKFYASRDRKSCHDKYSLAHGQISGKMNPRTNVSEYTEAIWAKKGTKIFEHFHYPENSIYLLIRRQADETPEHKKDRLMSMLMNRFSLD